MIRSMTGYGRGERIAGNIKYISEARSLNHRFLEVNVRLPQPVTVYEWEIRRLTSSLFSRGRIDINVKIEGAIGSEISPELNISLVEEYIRIIRELKDRFKLTGEISIDNILHLKDVIIFKEREGRKEEMKEALIGAVSDSLNALRTMRIEEGKIMEASIRQSISRINGYLGEIRERRKESVRAYVESIKERMREILQGMSISEERLYQEAALLAEKYDITEEVSRITSHISQFLAAIESEGASGRKLDFILQEIFRETNTISAKTQDISIIRSSLEIKNELEKIREQVQNVE